MTLNLTVISYAGRKPASPLAVSFGDRGGIIGREPSCDWVLEDPNGHVSKRHGRIEYVSGQYRIKDTSTNGIFLGDGGKRLGFGVSAVLKDGDLLHIGGYDIVVELSSVEEAQRQAARPGVATDRAENFDEAGAVLSRLANMVGQPAAPAPRRSAPPALGGVAGSPAAEQIAVNSPRPQAARAWGSPAASPGAAKSALAATPAARTQAAAPVAQEVRDRAAAQEARNRAAAQAARDLAAAQQARDLAAAEEARARAAAQEARARAAALEARVRAAAQEARAQAAEQEARDRAAEQEARARAAEQEARAAAQAERARAAAQAARERAAAQEARDRAAAQEARDRAAEQEARVAAQAARDRAAAQAERDRAAAQEARARAAEQEARARAAEQEARAAAQVVRDQAAVAAARRQALVPASRPEAAAPNDDLDTGGRYMPHPTTRPRQDRITQYDTGYLSAVIEDAETEDSDNQPSVSPTSLPGRDADPAGWLRWPSGDELAEMFGVPEDDGILTLTRVAEAVPIQPATLLDQVPLPPLAPDALEPLDLTGFEEDVVAARAANALAVVAQRKRATFGSWALAFSLCAAFIVVADLWIDRPVAIYLHRHFIDPGVIAIFENCVLGLMPLGAVMMLICGAMALSGKSLPRWAEAGTLSAFSLFWALPSTFFLLKPAFGRYDTTQFFSQPSLYGFAPFHGTVQSGFPSEHATIVAAVFSVFWIFFPRFRPLSSAAIGLVIGGLILLSWHFLSDVAAGLFVGTTSGVMTVRLWRNAQSGAVTAPVNPSAIRLAQN